MKQKTVPILTVDVTGRHIEISDSLRDHVIHHLQTVIEKYSQRPAQAKVIFSPEGDGFRCDCALHLDSGSVLKSSGEAMDIHASLSSMFSRIEKRLRRLSRRLKDKRVENGAPDLFSQSLPSGPEGTAGGASDRDAESADGEPAIIADPKAALENLSVAHAALKMEFADQPVYLFRNSAHGGLDLVYQRPDGNIGWADLNAYQGENAEPAGEADTGLGQRRQSER